MFNKNKGNLSGKSKDMDLYRSIRKVVRNHLEINASLEMMKRKLEEIEKSTDHFDGERADQFYGLPEEQLSIKDRTPEINTYILVHYFQKLANAIVEVAQCEAFRISSICREVCFEVLDNDEYRQRVLDSLRWRYKDFEHYREDMIAMLETLPTLEKDPDILPILYCMAKQKGSV